MELRHYGVKGMKWGVHRYYNRDGTLTDLGKARRRAKYRMDHEDGEKERKIKKLYSTDQDLVRKGEYWYNQHGEMMATQIYNGDVRRDLQNEANAVIQYMEKTGQWNRVIYDSDGVFALEVHSGPHHYPKQVKRHPPDGAHVHDHDEHGLRIESQIESDGRDMTESERNEHRELFRRNKTGRV